MKTYIKTLIIAVCLAAACTKPAAEQAWHEEPDPTEVSSPENYTGRRSSSEDPKGSSGGNPARTDTTKVSVAPRLVFTDGDTTSYSASLKVTVNTIRIDIDGEDGRRTTFPEPFPAFAEPAREKPRWNSVPEGVRHYPQAICEGPVVPCGAAVTVTVSYTVRIKDPALAGGLVSWKEETVTTDTAPLDGGAFAPDIALTLAPVLFDATVD